MRSSAARSISSPRMRGSCRIGKDGHGWASEGGASARLRWAVASRGRAGGIEPHDRARPARVVGVAARVALHRERLPALLARLAPERLEAEAEHRALGEGALEPVVPLERDAQRQRAV